MTTTASLPGHPESHQEPSSAAKAPNVSAASTKRGRGRSTTQATAVVELAAETELWCAPDGAAFATIEFENRREHWPVRSGALAQWLAGRHFEAHAEAPRAAAISDALAVLEGRARSRRGEHQVFTRVAGHEGRMYLDLGDEGWRAVEIGPGGWSVVTRPPVRFRRGKAMLALPEPVRGKSLSLLRRFINVCDDDWPLVASWLVAALRPTGPYPILFLHGEQGSGKSTQARVLRALVDPNSAPLRALPNDVRDLAVRADKSWVIALDNVSRLPGWLSDALCRLSTGGGLATRSRRANEEETIFEAQRPVLVNGIEDLASRSDLLDRALVVHLPSIPRGRRRSEADFWREFNHCRPWLVGALVGAAATALARLPLMRQANLPRLADFAQWGAAAEPALGCAAGFFNRIYFHHRQGLDLFALESSPIAVPVRMLVDAGPWRGTASDLLEALNRDCNSRIGERRSPDWPKSPCKLANALRRLAPNLRTCGLLIEFMRAGTTGRHRMISLRMRSDR